ncbi:hypothetical protein COL82_21725 [Bacillus toyonensis]|uniref:hypothetical protein n=1 Tax=Bacillus toyonensis TaxID=155322 RepID=UPI000279E534|nr:hypothetical protein [Bacillus toyonensis]EJR54420.1 hypothetical protein IIO_05746 [Bacillus cereus VD115]PFZ74667.1 hypothetical protein COL82_21725 [Bacillus toyonensis]PGA02406.1 hypothetical protein COL67_28690 [Bacillus toyonensis]PGB41355.1 hypothetical protein COM07_05160 [Bacillus toyonensis]PGE38865.1 hypothetical protein COM60_12620 [Bacillus toyonensis]
MVFIIVLLFIFIISIIFSLFSKGETQQEAKEVVNDIVTGPNGEILLIAAVVFIVGNIVHYDYELPSNPSMRNHRTPGKCAHYGGEWDTGGLFGEAKCVYNKTDESDNK